MADRTSRFRRLVGHYDGLLSFAMVATACAAAFPWLADSRWPNSASAIATFGVQCGWFALLHLWVLLGNHSLVRRLAVGFGWSLPAAIAMALHFDKTSSSYDPSQVSMFLAIRVATIIGVVLLGLVIRPLCRWRIGDGSAYKEEKRGLRIWDLLVLTFCCGLVLASVRPVLQVIEEDDFDRLIQYSVCELAPLVALLFCFGAACWWRRLEPHLFWVVPSIGIAASYVAFASPISNPSEWIPYEFRRAPLQEEGFFLMASCSMLVASAGLLWARAQGYQICQRYSPMVNIPVRSLWRPASTACLAVFCILYVAVHLFIDMPTYYRQDEEAWATARHIKIASRMIGRPPTGVGKKRFSWNSDTKNPTNVLTIRNSKFSYSVTDAQNLVGLVNLLVEPNAEGIDLETASMDAELLHAFSALQQAGRINLKGKCDPEALRDFLQGKQIESLVVHPMTIELASAVRDEGNVNQMTVYRVDGKPELVDVLRHLPIRSMHLSIDEPNELELHGFNKLRHLGPVGTEITTNVVEQLEACPKLSSLDFKECRFPTAAVKRMANLPVKSIVISYLYTEEHLPLKPLAEWADNGNLTSLRLSVPRITDHFATKFNLRRGMICCETFDSWGQDPDREDTQEQYDLASTLEKMAHRCERDEQGHITKLDLQWLLLDEEMASAIGKLPHLRELRYSKESSGFPALTPRNCFYLERNKKILSRLLAGGNLTTLELPTEVIDDEVLEEIGQLTRLKRLQLPTVVDDIAFPERIPMPFQLSEYKLVEILHITHRHELTTRDANYNQIRSVLDPSLIMTLAGLKELEYLLVPGFMVDATSLPTILGFSKLKHLHAPFSNFAAKDLKSLAQLKRLKSLTLGLPLDEILHLDELQSMADLTTLQLFLYGDETTEQQRVRFRQEIESLFPTTELHLHILPEPSDESY